MGNTTGKATRTQAGGATYHVSLSVRCQFDLFYMPEKPDSMSILSTKMANSYLFQGDHSTYFAYCPYLFQHPPLERLVRVLFTHQFVVNGQPQQICRRKPRICSLNIHWISNELGVWRARYLPWINYSPS